jgi:hypothetical protein
MLKVDFDDAEDLRRSRLDSDKSCGTRDLDQELEEGVHPKQCVINSDCRSREGNNSICACGLDGTFWCTAEWGSTYFAEFWNECDDNSGTVDNDFWDLW